MTSHAQYCQSCTFPYKQMGACPRPGESMFWAYISMVPYLIPIIIFIAFVITRKMRYLVRFSSLASCYIFGDKIIKNLIRSPRPLLSCKSSFGMPSSHMAVMAAFCFLEVKKVNPIYVKVLWILVTILQGYSRIVLNYHTLTQVIWGSLYGILYAFLFGKLWNKFIQPLVNNYINSNPSSHQQ